MKGKRVHKIVSSEGLALHGGELEKDGLYKGWRQIVQSPVLEARPWWKLSSAPDGWAVEVQTWQHKWFPCWAPSLLPVLGAAAAIDPSHLCWGSGSCRTQVGQHIHWHPSLSSGSLGSCLPQLMLGLSSLPQVSRSCLQMWVIWQLFLAAGVTGDNAVTSVKWLPSAGCPHCHL